MFALTALIKYKNEILKGEITLILLAKKTRWSKKGPPNSYFDRFTYRTVSVAGFFPHPLSVYMFLVFNIAEIARFYARCQKKTYKIWLVRSELWGGNPTRGFNRQSRLTDHWKLSATFQLGNFFSLQLPLCDAWITLAI